MARYLLATKLWERVSLESTGSALLAAFELHETEVRKATATCGELVHSGATGFVVMCEDAVKAISLAVKLARAHSRHKSAIPLTCCVVEGEVTATGELEPDMVKLLRELLNIAGASEISIAPSLVSVWQERGNRPLKGYRREFSRGELRWSLRFVAWEGHTKEPKKRRRIKAVTYAALIALPSLIILAVLFWFSIREMRHDKGPAVIIGPFNASFTAPPCTLSASLPPITRGRVLDYCSLKGRGIQFYHLAEGSMQLTGHHRRPGE